MNKHSPSGLARVTGHVQGALIAVATITALMFVILSLAVFLHPGPFFFDRPMAIAVQTVHVSAFDPFHALVSAMGGLVGVGVGAAVIVVTFLFMRRATPFVLFSVVYALIYNGVDLLIRRPRPTGLAHTVSNIGGHSFPSGHVAFFVWLAVLAYVLLLLRLPATWRMASVLLLTVLVIAAAISRVYVGAHWPSDVAGGLLVGIGWSAFSLSLGRLTEPLTRMNDKFHRVSNVLAAPAV